MPREFIVLLSLLVCFYWEPSLCIRGHFTLVAPGTIRSNSQYIIALSLDDFGNRSSLFNITVTSPCNAFKTNPIFGHIQVEVAPKSTMLVRMQIPKLTHTCGTLHLLGTRGIIYQESATLNVELHDFIVFIQTDKAKYKPGEVMQFRVICIDRLTRPAQVTEAIDVFIYDGRRNLVKKMSDVKLIQGVFRAFLQLAEYPVLGDWTIEVKADGYTMHDKSFEVARYDVAKFSVEIDTKRDVALEEGRIDVKVKSRYTYGQLVIGNLSVTLTQEYSAYKRQSGPVTKFSPTDGEAFVSFEISTNVCQTQHTFILSSFEVIANVTDSSTGHSRSASTQVRVYCNPYKVEVSAPHNFNSKDSMNITVSVKDLQGNPVRDPNNPVTIRIASMPYYMKHYLPESDPFTPQRQYGGQKLAYLNESGLAATTMNFFNLSRNGVYVFGARAEYRNSTSRWIRLYEKITDVFTLDLLTSKPEVGKEFAVQLSSLDPIRYFSYEIVSRGDIVRAGRKEVPGNETEYYLRLNATHDMTPKITIYVHRTLNSVLDCRLKEVLVKRTFKNSIRIQAEDRVKPGSMVSVNVTTNKDSYVGLSGIDERLLLDTKQHDDLNEDNLFTKIRNFDSINMNTEIFPGAAAGLIVFSNAMNRGGGEINRTPLMSGEEQKPMTLETPNPEFPMIRKWFSDTWLFQDFERTVNGSLQLLEKIPDSITSWSLSGFSLNPETGLTFTKNATNVKVFQEFFISMDLPSLVRPGEAIEIPVYVYNYMNQDLLTNLTLEVPTEVIQLQPIGTVSQLIFAKDQATFIYLLRARRSGRFNLTVRAMSSLISDVLQKPLIVEPEGMPYSVSKVHLINFLHESEQQNEISVEIPDNVIQGSTRIELSVMSDVFSSLLKKLEQLVRVPYGNIEDNMRLFMSNLLVLKYFKALNHSNPVIENKAKLYLELAYQNLQAFKQLDGSYGLLDRSVSRIGDIRTTAYIMWALELAKEYMQVDCDGMERGKSYLKLKQAENGSFKSGKGVEEDVALTAFSLLAFLVPKENSTKYKDLTAKGLEYLYVNFHSLNETASNAISLYALVLGNHHKSEELLVEVKNNTAHIGKHLTSSKSDTIQSALETAAYSFMTILESQKDSLQTLFPILQTMMSVGGKGNSPIHMVSLEAIIKYAKKLKLNTNNIRIHFEDDQGGSGDFHLTTENAETLQKIEVNMECRILKLCTKGQGFALVELQYKYNLPYEQISSPNYATNVTISEEIDPRLKVCITRQSSGTQSCYTRMQVSMQTGLEIDESSFEVVKWKNKRVMTIQFNGNKNSLLVLLHNVTQIGSCIEVVVRRAFKVSNARPVSLIVSDPSDAECLSEL